MKKTLFILIVAFIGTHGIKVELNNEKTPYDYVKERLDAIPTDRKFGLPLSDSYEVEESEDYPQEEEKINVAASTVLNTVAGASGIGVGQGIGLGGIGLGGYGIGQGLGLGLGGLGAGARLGIGSGIGGVGLNSGGIGTGGVGLINPALGGIGLGGIGFGNGLLYHPILGAQVGAGYVDKKAYDVEEKKGADANVEKLEKKAAEEAKHGQEGFQQAAAAAKAEKGESSFYKDEEAKKKAAGDEKFYEGGQKIDKHGGNEEQLKKAKSHKKGHVHKGFKSSSSKNEEEKSEHFYDEAHDEADHKVSGHNAGSFGENAQQGYKGAHEEKVLDANAQGKEGHHSAHENVDDSKANKGEFLHKGYKEGTELLEKFNNLGAQAVHGHQEASGGYQQNKGILPIHY
ncbi:ATP-dependent RNA helicase glh-1 [Bicyclus anynana]|uniref:ATP-dependent RNA helicase glh-1 n=1 Tax=Bicyclus anynana TaxID=110368 RepID=A0A6J1NHH8_BICAN|nr:ATP-dependent RNA helicase glh-1 [Bicyclus anynana]